MKVSSTEVQNNFGKYLKIASELEDVIITRKGREVAKIVPIGERSIIAEEAADYIYNDRWRLSYEEFLKLVENSDLRYEYIDGEVYLLASPAYNHQVCVSELFVIFYTGLKERNADLLRLPLMLRLLKARITLMLCSRILS